METPFIPAWEAPSTLAGTLVSDASELSDD